MSARLQRRARERSREKPEHRGPRRPDMEAWSSPPGEAKRGKVEQYVSLSPAHDLCGMTNMDLPPRTRAPVPGHDHHFMRRCSPLSLPCLVERPVSVAAHASDARRVSWQNTRTAHAQHECTVSHAFLAPCCSISARTWDLWCSRYARYARPQACLARGASAACVVPLSELPFASGACGAQ